jgi:hypothetical protein
MIPGVEGFVYCSNPPAFKRKGIVKGVGEGVIVIVGVSVKVWVIVGVGVRVGLGVFVGVGVFGVHTNGGQEALNTLTWLFP